MKDINFFDSYIVRKKIKIDRQIAFYIAGAIFIILIIIYSVFNQFRIVKLSKEITTLNSVLEDEKVNKKIDEINEKNNELDSLKDNINQTEIQEKFIDENATIDDSILEMITSSMQDDVFLTSLSLYTDKISIIGKAKDQLQIANFIDNLESFEKIKEVFVSSISKEEQYYSFILDLRLKEVMTDGENTVIEEPEN